MQPYLLMMLLKGVVDVEEVEVVLLKVEEEEGVKGEVKWGEIPENLLTNEKGVCVKAEESSMGRLGRVLPAMKGVEGKILKVELKGEDEAEFEENGEVDENDGLGS